MDKQILKPLVSVAIPSYNHASFVQDAIRSVINQTYENIELIIIDDGSTDQSLNKIEELMVECKQRFVRFEFRHRSNKGLSNTLNEALDWAEGEYFCALASDDQMLEEKTFIQLDIFKKNPMVSAVVGAHQYIDNKNRIISIKKAPYKEFSFRDVFHHKHDIPASSQMIRCKNLRGIGGYNEKTMVEDWDLWLRLTEDGAKLVYIPDIIVSYRMHDNNLSKDKALMFNEVLELVKRYKGYRGFPYAEYMVYKLYKVRPAKEKSYLLYLFLRLKYTFRYLIKSIRN